MNKHFKLLSAIFAVAMLLGTLLAGCASQGPAASAEATTAAAETSAAEASTAAGDQCRARHLSAPLQWEEHSR